MKYVLISGFICLWTVKRKVQHFIKMGIIVVDVKGFNLKQFYPKKITFIDNTPLTIYWISELLYFILLLFIICLISVKEYEKEIFLKRILEQLKTSLHPIVISVDTLLRNVSSSTFPVFSKKNNPYCFYHSHNKYMYSLRNSRNLYNWLN